MNSRVNRVRSNVLQEKKEKVVDYDVIAENKKNKKKNNKKKDGRALEEKIKDTFAEEKAAEAGEKKFRGNDYAEIPAAKMLSTKAEKSGIADSLPRASVPLPPPKTSVPSLRGRPLTVSDNTGEYAEIVDADTGSTSP